MERASLLHRLAHGTERLLWLCMAGVMMTPRERARALLRHPTHAANGRLTH
jgi:hypothetical protein